MLKSYSDAGMQPLPNEAQCPECGYFDLSHPDVQRILGAGGWKDTAILRVECRCQLREAAIKARALLRHQQANLPHPLHPRTFANFTTNPEVDEAILACKQFAAGKGPRAITLFGLEGRGKSHLMEATARMMLDQGAEVRYEYVPTLIDRLRHSHDDDSEQDLTTLMMWYDRITVLFLDDLGAERRTPFGVEKLEELVNSRLLSERPLMITTNYTYAQLVDRVGPRLASRVHQRNPELGDMLVVPMMGKDYRR